MAPTIILPLLGSRLGILGRLHKVLSTNRKTGRFCSSSLLMRPGHGPFSPSGYLKQVAPRGLSLSLPVSKSLIRYSERHSQALNTVRKYVAPPSLTKHLRIHLQYRYCHQRMPSLSARFQNILGILAADRLSWTVRKYATLPFPTKY